MTSEMLVTKLNPIYFLKIAIGGGAGGALGNVYLSLIFQKFSIDIFTHHVQSKGCLQARFQLDEESGPGFCLW